MNMKSPTIRLVAALWLAAVPLAAQSSPKSVADELIAADRAFSAASANTDLIAGLSAMFADDVTMPAPPGRFYRTKPDAIAALQGNPSNAGSKAVWTPIRGGVSADGLHGFTFGVMTIKRGDGVNALAKYLAYWVKGSAGWRVAAYKRVGRAEGSVPTDLIAPSLPTQPAKPVTDASTIERHRTGLVAAEQAFSDLAQTVGLGPAFKESGSEDAINLGGAATAGFVIGNDAIAKLVQGDAPITDGRVHWSAEWALVASSGDLGVTFGYIKTNGPPPDGAPANGNPFFTIWRRAGPNAPWKYIAE